MMATDNTSTAEILNRGMNCLIQELGVVEAERFISAVIREKTDYTKWRQRYFDDIDSDSFHAAAVEYGKKNPL